MKKFWMIIKVPLNDAEFYLKSPPKKKHYSFSDAQEEIKRLVKKEQDRFVLLEAIEEYKPKKYEKENLNIETKYV